ncbi:uncharacterized protein [Argopecten irradians]|uniref:uncharacterized protein n=1 Tax=Argopecten irradians TaxID=31199 RepID=UPI0037106B03
MRELPAGTFWLIWQNGIMDKTTFLFVYTALLKVVNSSFNDLFLSPRQLTWGDSIQYCEENGGRLLVMDSQEKWDYFTADQDYTALGLFHGHFWIGMKFDDSVLCDASNNWIYQGWGHWANDNEEPNYCPSDRCIKLKNNWMRTDNCLEPLTAICQIDSTTELSTTISTTDVTITSFEPTTTYVVSEKAATFAGTERTDSTSAVQTTGSDDFLCSDD